MQKKIRPLVIYGLVFFVFAVNPSCTKGDKNNKITIQWKDKKAVGIVISGGIVETINPDYPEKLLEVRLTAEKPVPILGEYSFDNQTITFNPLIPFTHGLHYEVWHRNLRIGTFFVPAANSADAPTLLGIFPTADTLPENLLKIYLHFSQPMREGQSAQYVTLLKNNSDSIPGAFLDLQPELWNKDRTILTLWLDPGRIKRDLQPNKLLGAPLKKNANYTITVSAKWPDTNGAKLVKTYTKTFVTNVRDSLSPRPMLWKVNTPPMNTKQPLTIAFGEPLDYSLLKEALTILTADEKNVKGTWQISEKESKSAFTPDKNWESGKYDLRIETRLEDLAGNNLNRPFDRDKSQKENKDPKDFDHVLFRIEN